MKYLTFQLTLIRANEEMSAEAAALSDARERRDRDGGREPAAALPPARPPALPALPAGP